jgi:predicted amidohydrolase YtcJ
MATEQIQIFGNGVVFTALHERPWASAVAINGADVIGVGDLADLREAWPAAEVVDLTGGTLLPGLVDAHNHFLSTGESLASWDLRYPGVDSPEALLDVVRRAATAAEPGETLSGFGFDNAKYALPSLAELDAASTGHPVQFFHTSGHNVLVNSVVLARNGIDEHTPDPAGGRFVRDAEGRLTGLCLDGASGAVVPSEVDIGSHGPNFHSSASLDSLVGAVDRAGRAFRAAGLTCVADAQVTSRELRGYQAARERELLHLRTVCMPLSHQLGEFAGIGLTGPFGDDLLSIGHLKIYADGSLTGGTAAFTPDAGVKGQDALYFNEPHDLIALIERAWTLGWRIGVHAQGDEAIGHVLTGFERAAAAVPRADTRPRIEHAGLPTASGVERMAALGVIAVNQPSYLADFGDEYADSLGNLADDMQPWRDELEAGVRVVISSDSDVTTYRPLVTIANAMQRRTLSGRVLGERHRLSLDEALFAHTIDAAYAVGREDRIGSLEPGKAADLTWLGSDLRAVTPDEVADVEVVATYLDGVRR